MHTLRQCLALTILLCACVSGISAQQSETTPPPDATTKTGFQSLAAVAPTFSWATGTQNQKSYGGNALFSAIKSARFCDSATRQFGVNASASDTRTAKSAKAGGGAPTYIDSNDVKFDAMTGLGGRGKNWTSNFGAVDADFFENTSLGIGLQTTVAGQYQFDFGCKYGISKNKTGETNIDGSDKRFFAALGIGFGYMNQRLYKTTDRVSSAVLPLSAQFSYLIGGNQAKSGEKKGPPKFIWSASLGYLPVLNNGNAYQLSGITSLQIPTQISWLTLSLTDTDLYANNAPPGHKRNYNNGTISLVFSFPKKSTSTSEIGACYGNDKTQRIYCYEGVTSESCTGANIFVAKSHCSSAGSVPALQLN